MAALNKKIAVIWFCFFLSGLSGLIYEVVWVRQFELVFGTSTYAVGAILTAFMAGLSLGGWAGGKKADGTRQPLRVYGLLEIFIGLYALVFPFLFQGIQWIYLLLESHWALPPAGSLLIRFLAAFFLLILPTSLMGATLPFLTKVLSDDQVDSRWSVGKLYGVNTVGAVLGVLLTGFFLIPHWGQSATLGFAAFLNLSLGAAILWISQNGKRVFENFFTQQTRGRNKPRTGFDLALLLTAFSGFSAMVYENCYNRILAMTLGGSVYAFSTMLATFLTGLSLGALAITAVSGFFRKRVRLWLAVVLAGAGLTALATGVLFDRLGFFFFWLYQSASAMGLDITQSQRPIQFFVSAVVMLPTALLLGSTFPLIIQMEAFSFKDIGHWVGRVYSWNTLGAIGGSFLAAFVLIPLLGIQMTLLMGVFIHLSAAVILAVSLFRASKNRHWGWTAAFSTCLLVLLSLLPVWNRHRMAIGPYIQVKYLGKDPHIVDTINNRVNATELVFYREGVATTVTVERNRANNTLFLSNNGKPEASTRTDLPTQQLISDFPLLWFEASRKRPAGQVALIGLASGITAGAALQHGIDRLTAVELEPFMPQAAEIFKDYNFNVLADPKLHLVSDDGRHHLKMNPGQYDVIVSEPSNPWISGVANLFTKESFETSRRALTPDGVFCQWVQVYEMKLDDLKTIVRTFHSVFPNTYLFGIPPHPGEKAPAADLVLLGSMEPLVPQISVMDRVIREPKLQAALRRIGISESGDLVSLLRLGPSEITAFEGKGPLNLDDNALIEFSAPLSLYRDTYYEDLMEIRKFQCDPTNLVETDSRVEKRKLLLRVAADLYPYWRRDLAVQLKDRANHLKP